MTYGTERQPENFFLFSLKTLRNQPHKLICGQCQHAKHEVAHYLGSTSDTNRPPSRRTHPSSARSLAPHLFVRCSEYSLEIPCESIFVVLIPHSFPVPVPYLSVGFLMRTMETFWPSSAMIKNSRYVVGGIHQVVKIGDALCGYCRQRNRYLAVMH